MTENIKKLLEMLSTNEELQDKLSKASKDEIISIAKDNGITLSDADFEQSGEFSDDELDSVAGGKQCKCIFGGGGTGESSKDNKTCACVISGWGHQNNGDLRCHCTGGGIGHDHVE